jgi:hypothetical protein
MSNVTARNGIASNVNEPLPLSVQLERGGREEVSNAG